jgi:hypothetical protein
MSDFVQWITAQAEDPVKAAMTTPVCSESGKQAESGSSADRGRWQNLPAHSFQERVAGVDEGEAEPALDRNPDIWLYRKRTTGLLRRYLRLSLEAGRLPSVIGREFFRAKITTYTSVTFEDRVIFVHDVEACLERLAAFDQAIIARVVLQEQDHERAARLLGCTRKTIERRLPEVIDEMSEEFLRVGLLVPLPKKEGPELARPFLA